MHTPELEQLLRLAKERFATIFENTIEMGEVSLASFRPPYFVRSLGLCARLSLYSAENYRGPHADLVVLPRERFESPDDAWAALEAQIAALRGDARPALGRPLGETLGLREVDAAKVLWDDPLRDEERAASLAKMTARFDAAHAKFHEHYGLRLPRWMAVLAALFDSLDELERSGLETLGRSGGGVLEYFEDGGLERAIKDGLDARLEMRFRRDPPEMVSFLWGDSDGGHFGLFYDDPAELPARIVNNYARDSGETWCEDETTGISLLHRTAIERLEDPYRAADDPVPVALYALERAIRYFVSSDEAAVAQDGPVPFQRDERVQLLGGMSAVVPASAFKSARARQTPESRYQEYKRKTKIVREWIDEAREELAKGKPGFAYVLGRELHWFDGDAHRAAGAELLIGAYEALGRHALADIARVHTRHRDLGSVGVFIRE